MAHASSAAAVAYVAVAELPVAEASPLVAGVSTDVSVPAPDFYSAVANLVVVGLPIGADVVRGFSAAAAAAAAAVVDLALSPHCGS